MKIALITDSHFGARNDNLTFMEYFFKFYDNIFFPYLEKHNISTVIHLGDVVDRRKYINFVILNKFRNDYVLRLEKMGIDQHYLVGNHDAPYRNSNDINSMTELFTGVNASVYSNPAETVFDGTKILLVPWINSSNHATSIRAMKKTAASVMLGHFEIQGFEMYKGFTNDDGFDTPIFDNFDLVCSGHFHHKSTKDNITYLGAPYQITWSDYNDARGFHILDTDTKDLEYIQNPYQMFHKVFYDDEDTTPAALDKLLAKDYSDYAGSYVKVIVQKRENPYWFDMFLNELYKIDVQNIQIVDDHSNLHLEDDEDILDEIDDTPTILSKWIDGMELTINKKKLDILMRNLYAEAITLE